MPEKTQVKDAYSSQKETRPSIISPNQKHKRMNEQTLTFLQLLVEAKNINSCASLSVFGTFRTLLTIENQQTPKEGQTSRMMIVSSSELKWTLLG